MRLLLVDPYYLSGTSPPSWVLGQLEAVFRAEGHDVAIRDFCVDARRLPTLGEFRLAEAAFIQEIVATARECDLVYFTTSFGVPQKPTPILARVRRALTALMFGAPGVPIVIGGAQIDYLTVHGCDPYVLLGRDTMQVCCFASSDALLPRCARALEQQCTFDEVPGIWLPMQGRGRFTGTAPKWDLDFTCRPNWQGWDLSRYPDYRAVLTSLGCRYGCSFCFESKQQFQKLDITALLAGFLSAGANKLAIEDSTLLGAHGLDALVDALRRLPSTGRYTCYSLVAEICKASPAGLRALRAHGVESVVLGIETSDSQVLRRYRKSVTSDRARVAIDALHGAGMTAQGCLMVGIPEVDRDTTFSTLDYAADLRLDAHRWHVFQPTFEKMPQQIETRTPVSLDRFALIDVNVPDHLLPSMMEGAPIETFLEEHFLMRALPFMREAPEMLEQVRYTAGYTLRELYDRLLQTLPSTQDSFNEEDYYAVLNAPEADPSEICAISV